MNGINALQKVKLRKRILNIKCIQKMCYRSQRERGSAIVGAIVEGILFYVIYDF